MIEPTYYKGLTCQECWSTNTVALMDKTDSPAAVMWCSCGVVSIFESHNEHSKKVFQFGSNN